MLHFGSSPCLPHEPKQKLLDIRFSSGDVLRFRLLANPTKRLSAGCPGAKVDGPRVGLFKEATSAPGLGARPPAQGLHCWLSSCVPLARSSATRTRARIALASRTWPCSSTVACGSPILAD